MKKMLIVLSCLSCLFFTGSVFADVPTSQSEAGSESKIITTDNSTSNVYNRQFVNPGSTPMPMTNGFFTAPTPDSSFRSVKDILKVFTDGYVMRFTKGAIIAMAKGGDVHVNFSVIRDGGRVARVFGVNGSGGNVANTDIVHDEWFMIGIEAPKFEKGKLIGTSKIPGLKVTGLIDAESDDADTNSVQVIGKAALKAMKDGNNYLILTAEGAHRKVEASGWGFGFYTVGGTVSDSGKGSGIVGGGTGFAMNETGPEDRPWIQGYTGCVAVE